MLILFLLGLPFTILNALASFLPLVSELPFGIDAVLVQGMGYFWFLANVFPPAQVMWNGLVVILGFKMVLKLIAMIPIVRGILHK